MKEHDANAAVQRIQAIITDLAAALTYNDVARVIIERCVPSVGAAVGAMWLLDEATHEMKLIRSRDDEKSVLFETNNAGTPVADVCESKVPIFMGAREDFERRYPKCAAGFPDIASALWLPLNDRGRRVTGVLALGFAQPRVFDLDERTFWILMGDQCAQALYRARIYEREQRARWEMGLLYNLVDAVSRATSVSQVCDPSLDAVEKALGVSRSSILLLDDEGGREATSSSGDHRGANSAAARSGSRSSFMRFKAWRGLSSEYRAAVEGHSPWSLEDTNPQPLLVTDVESDEGMASYLPVLRKEGIRALGFFPLIHRGRLLGKFMVYSSVPRTFTVDEIRVAQTVAGQIALAVGRKRSEQQLEVAFASAEHANRMKDEFLAVVSHELRTPLAAILGWAAILQTERRSDPNTVTKGLGVIERNAKAQASIIDDILDVSRIIRGKLHLDPHPITLVPIILDTIEGLRTSARAKEIVVTFDTDAGDDPFSLIGDADRLRQVAWNLISNAIKFTPAEGRVSVKLTRDLGAIILEVRDSGVGISAEHLPFVFDRFRQVDSTTTRRQGGLGLGLSIVRHLVELHGGQVAVTSDGPGNGSTFTARFPVRALETTVPTTALGATGSAASAEAPFAADADAGAVAGARSNALDLSGVRVLVVDDLPDAREMLKEALMAFGAAVDVAGSALEAVERLKSDKSDGVDVLVTDIGMPDIDGFALLRRVRALPGRNARLPAIAITAYARFEDVRRARDAGFHSHVAKPARPEMLAQAVADALPSHHP